MLAKNLELRLDPAAFMEAAGAKPDPWQAQLLRSGAPRMLLLCGRQTGKSTVAAVMALHEAIYRPPALCLLLSPSLRQSGELFRKVTATLHSLETPPRVAEESQLRLELQNGSRIVSLPGEETTIRGFSGVRLLIVDEAARVPDELYYSTRPMLAVSGGRLAALTTPFGKRGFFYEAWTSGAQSWQRVKITAKECPRIPASFLEDERREIGSWWFAQEYGCEFVETTDSVFLLEDIEAALSDGVEPLFPVLSNATLKGDGA